NSPCCVVGLSAKPAQVHREDGPPPVREIAIPKVAKPERDGCECQPEAWPPGPIGEPLLQQSSSHELMPQRQPPNPSQKRDRRGGNQIRRRPEADQPEY